MFASWDGCSEGNEDWKICKVKMDGVTTKNIVATYTQKQAAAQAPKATPNTAPICVKQDPADATQASCKFTFASVPAKTVLEIKMYANECGRSLKVYLTFTYPAPCQKEYAGYYDVQTADSASSTITCSNPAACTTDLEVNASNNNKRTTITQPGTIQIKVPRDTTLQSKTYCRYNCEPMPGWFNEWAYTYDAATKTFRVTAFYLYRGFDG